MVDLSHHTYWEESAEETACIAASTSSLVAVDMKGEELVVGMRIVGFGTVEENWLVRAEVVEVVVASILASLAA
jgi:hypothetical protein